MAVLLELPWLAQGKDPLTSSLQDHEISLCCERDKKIKNHIWVSAVPECWVESNPASLTCAADMG